MRWLLALVALAACEGPPAESAHCAAFHRWEASDFDGALLRCDRAPGLCDLPVVSELGEPDLALAIDVVFVGDGFTAATLDAYRDQVTGLIAALRSDPDSLVGRDPSLFNFHRVDLVSPDGSDVVAGGRPLHSCVDFSGDQFLLFDPLLVARAAHSAPAVDLVVVVAARLPEARGSASIGPMGDLFVVMNGDDDEPMLTHELGHALVGLGDEYVDIVGLDPRTSRVDRWSGDPYLEPNLSIDPAETWGGLVDGALEGGDRCSQGVYHPTAHCRMGDDEASGRFCPVCAAAVDDFLAARRGSDDGPPTCVIAAGQGAVTFMARDASGVASLRLAFGDQAVDIEPPAQAPLAPWAPIRYEIGATLPAGKAATLTCVDTAGNTSTARLDP